MINKLIIVFISSIFTCYATFQPDDSSVVVFVSLIYRHGERTLIGPYPNDPYKKDSSSPTTYGELTKYGKLQHYQLGHWLRRQYSDLLPTTYSRDDIYVQSTDTDRTLMSAQANLAGLYPIDDQQKWYPGLDWIPIPVHTIPQREDYVLGARKPCAAYDEEYQTVLNSTKRQNLEEINGNTLKYLSDHSHFPVKSVFSVGMIYDALLASSIRQEPLPDWARFIFPRRLESLIVNKFMLAAMSRSMQRLKAGPLIGEIIEHMLSKSKNNLKPNRKMWMYSAHDGTLINVLMSLKMFDMQYPPYAAMLAIELRKNLKEQYFVTIYYKVPRKTPEYLQIPSCGYMCPLEEFVELNREVIPQNWDKECTEGFIRTENKQMS